MLLATQFIEAFTPLNDRLVEVDSVVGHLEQSCVAVSDRLRNAETAMMQFTERAADLQKRRDEMLVQADEVRPPGSPSMHDLTCGRRPRQAHHLHHHPSPGPPSLHQHLVPIPLTPDAANLAAAAATAVNTPALTCPCAHDEQVSAFLSHYTLTPHEVHALQTVDLDQGASPHHQLGQMPPLPPPGGHMGGLESVGPAQFFAALERLQQVRLECQRLVGSRHQSAAFELLETLSQQQEQVSGPGWVGWVVWVGWVGCGLVGSVVG